MPARQSREPEEEKPPPQRMKRYWKVAVLANIKDEAQPKPDGVPPDAFADYDHIETIDALRAAIETDGHKTAFIPADRNLPFSLKEVQPDICFNIAEGLGGDAREAQVPALLEMLGIPYTGSRVLANGIGAGMIVRKPTWENARVLIAVALVYGMLVFFGLLIDLLTSDIPRLFWLYVIFDGIFSFPAAYFFWKYERGR